MRIGWQVIALGLAFCTLWSSAFTVGKFSIQAAPPLWFLTIRFGLGFFVMWAVLAVMHRGLPRSRREWVTGIWLGILNNALYLGACYIAFQWVSSGMVAMIASLMPLVTAALAWPLLGEKLTARKLAGLALGLGGAWFILGNRLAASGLDIDDPTGLAIATVGMICLACGTVLYKRRGSEADPLAMNAVQAGAAAVFLLPAALLLEPPDIIFGWTLLWTQAYTVIVMTFATLLLWFALIRKAGAGAASAFHFLNPGIALLIAWVVLSEPITLTDILGLIPVAAGILLVNWPAGRSGARAKSA
jgi:drug/metabolite transporter (DMT)-like permease